MEKDVQSQIQELEGKIQTLRSSQLGELKQKLKEARQNVAQLEAELAKTTGKTPVASGRRKRTSSEDVRSQILKALANERQGLSQKEIADRAELNYNTVVLYLKNHKKDFKSTGTRRAKRYFLK
jgi:DNA-binding NarL/FixJ family response regulator